MSAVDHALIDGRLVRFDELDVSPVFLDERGPCERIAGRWAWVWPGVRVVLIGVPCVIAGYARGRGWV